MPKTAADHRVPTLIVGIGNVLRSDDGAGPRVIDKLRQLGFASTNVQLESFPQWLPEHALELATTRRLIVIDASVSLDPGEVQLLRLAARRRDDDRVSPALALAAEKTRDRVPIDGPTNHDWTLPWLLDLAVLTTGAAPRTCLWTIGIESLEFGERLTPAVETAVTHIAQRLLTNRRSVLP